MPNSVLLKLHIVLLSCCPRVPVVSRSQTAFPSILNCYVIGWGEGSGTLLMRHLCRDPPELGGNNCILAHALPGNRPPTTTGVAQAVAMKAMIHSVLSF